VFGLAVVGTVLAVSFGRMAFDGWLGGDAPSTSATPLTTVATARYVEYRTIRQLATSSTIVVRARAIRRLPSYVERPTLPAGLPARKAAAAGLIKTDVVFQVESKIHGKGSPEEVRVVHLGGEAGRQRLVVEGEPVSSVGASYILFLRAGSNGRYSIVGGSQGRYRIVNGRLQLVSRDVAEAPVPRALRGLRAAALEQQFATLLRSRNFDPPTAERLTEPGSLQPTPQVDKPAPPPGEPPPRPSGG
jgi:hypothetical protein